VDIVREMRVMTVGVESDALQPVLLLQEARGNHRLLPVWVGIAEANAITVEQQRVRGGTVRGDAHRGRHVSTVRSNT
jgi:bifunctional DNase/RNase